MCLFLDYYTTFKYGTIQLKPFCKFQVLETLILHFDFLFFLCTYPIAMEFSMRINDICVKSMRKCILSPSLLKQVASAVSNEVRAFNNDYVRRGLYETHTGLNCFSPVINIMRHPLWGRNQVYTGLLFEMHYTLFAILVYYFFKLTLLLTNR